VPQNGCRKQGRKRHAQHSGKPESTHTTWVSLMLLQAYPIYTACISTPRASAVTKAGSHNLRQQPMQAPTQTEYVQC
jgi:hypothetical protein